MARHTHTTTTTKPKTNPLAKLANVFAILNLLIFAVCLGLAAHLVDRYFSGVGAVLRLTTRGPVVIAFLFFALLASSVGIATNLLGFIPTTHPEAGRLASLAGNHVTLALTYLAAGFGIKSLKDKLFSGGSQYPKEIKALAALFIIAMLTQLLYVIALALVKHEHTTHPITEHNTGYNNNGVDTLPTHSKQMPVGHHHHNAAPMDNRAAIA